MKVEQSWALDAALKGIEREALTRATRIIQAQNPTMFGLNAEQVAALIEFFHQHTGKATHGLTPGQIRNMELKK